MKETNCETALMAKMAELDGEDAGISIEMVNSHLSICENCRIEFERMRNVSDLFARQVRRESEMNLWSWIEPRIGAENSRSANWKTFALLGAILVAYKLLETFPEADLGFAFNLMPLVFAVALFIFLKENPFRINQELGLEK